MSISNPAASTIIARHNLDTMKKSVIFTDKALDPYNCITLFDVEKCKCITDCLCCILNRRIIVIIIMFQIWYGRIKCHDEGKILDFRAVISY